jgi:dihydroflavonol-4-reductase
VSVRSVFLTGATGFIGTRLSERLSAAGWRLRCLVRSEARAARLRALGAELVVGDLTDRARLTQAMQTCELAYHLAGIYDLGVIDEAALQRTNVEGTRAFLDAVASAGIRKAVHVSTTVALGPSTEGESERFFEYDGPYPTAYHRTKAAAHRHARAAQDQGLPLVIVCPAYVYGPGDGGPAGRFINDLLQRRIPGLFTRPGWFSFVHVEDVARGLQLAGEQGQPGATYVLSGEPASLNDFALRIARLGEVRAPLLRFPPMVASLTGRLLDGLSRVTGKRFSISRESVAATARQRWLHSNARARNELHWQPRSLDAGLPETVAWFKAKLD